MRLVTLIPTSQVGNRPIRVKGTANLPRVDAMAIPTLQVKTPMPPEAYSRPPVCILLPRPCTPCPNLKLSLELQELTSNSRQSWLGSVGSQPPTWPEAAVPVSVPDDTGCVQGPGSHRGSGAEPTLSLPTCLLPPSSTLGGTALTRGLHFTHQLTSAY